jgi:hypothetical protein
MLANNSCKDHILVALKETIFDQPSILWGKGLIFKLILVDLAHMAVHPNAE